MCRFTKGSKMKREKKGCRNCKWSHMFCETWLSDCVQWFQCYIHVTLFISFQTADETKKKKNNTRRRIENVQENLLSKSVSCGDISVIFVGIETRLNEWLPFKKPNRIRTGKFKPKILQTFLFFWLFNLKHFRRMLTYLFHLVLLNWWRNHMFEHTFSSEKRCFCRLENHNALSY